MSGYYDSSMEAAVADVMIVVLIVMMIVMLLALVYSLVTYILGSLGMYTIAKRRGIKNPWMAWIPVCDTYLLGTISDQYQYVAKAKVTNRRKIMLGLAIASMVLSVVDSAFSYNASFSVMSNAFSGSYVDEEALMEQLMSATAGIGWIATLISVVSLALTVFRYIAYYDLYNSCNPNNGVLYLVLSILLSFLTPFLIFSCRNKDLGMPPRKDQTAPGAPVPPAMPEPAPEPGPGSTEEAPASEAEEDACEDLPGEDEPAGEETVGEDLSEPEE